jgi:transposase InsO family protein
MVIRIIVLLSRQLFCLLLLCCRTTRSKDIELLVLRQELAILRRQVNRPRVKPEERMVLAVLQRLRPVWERTSSLVTPDTLRRWHRELIRRKWTQPHRVTPKRAVSQQTQLLVWRLSKENPLWGYQRIQGELLKVGIEISASSIRRVIGPKRRPGPKRDTWSKFMRTQAASIVACDLFTVETVRMKTLHVLFFIDLHTRRVLIGGVTDGATNVKWCTQIARNLSEVRESRSTRLRFLVHDRDHRFGEPFDEVFKAEGVEIIRTPWRAPRANAYAERFVRTVRAECLDRIFLLNERHLESVLRTYLNHYNQERPHRGLDLRIPEGGPPVSVAGATGSIVRRDRLGGLIHEYHRKAA